MSHSKDVIFQGNQVLLDGELQRAAIIVGCDGKISKIFRDADLFSVPEGVEIIDVGDLVLMPGIIDSHVHVNEPGRTEWEGFKTASSAAAAGGITTIVDMPLNSLPPTTTVNNFNKKLDATEGKLHVDVGFWGGVIPKNEMELRGLIKAGVVGFKCFLCNSGVPEFPYVSISEVDTALQVLHGQDCVLAFHAECDLEQHVASQKKADPMHYQTFLDTRPPEMEVEAIQKVVQLCKAHRTPCHIVHLSAAEGLKVIEDAKTSGAPLTVETCHHYLSLASEFIPDGATQFKCCPPIRGSQNREELWRALASGLLDMVVSDHSPATPDLKMFSTGDFMEAWGGIASLQFGLSLFWTEALKRGFTTDDVSRLLTRNPAKLCGLDTRKGQIKEGMDADFVIWDPHAQFQVQQSMIHFKNWMTPYLGMQLQGKVERTVVRGHTVYENGEILVPPTGKVILRNTL